MRQQRNPKYLKKKTPQTVLIFSIIVSVVLWKRFKSPLPETIAKWYMISSFGNTVIVGYPIILILYGFVVVVVFFCQSQQCLFVSEKSIRFIASWPSLLISGAHFLWENCCFKSSTFLIRSSGWKTQKREPLRILLRLPHWLQQSQEQFLLGKALRIPASQEMKPRARRMRLSKR